MLDFDDRQVNDRDPQWDLHMILNLMIPMTMDHRSVRMNPIRDVKEAAAFGGRR